MYKSFVAGLAILLIMEGVLPVSAVAEATEEKEQASPSGLRAGKKVAHGTRDMLLGWTEIPKEVAEVRRETKNPTWGLLAGSFRGAMKAVQVTTSGITEVITAPVAAEKKR